MTTRRVVPSAWRADIPAWDVQTVRCSARASLEVSKRRALYEAKTPTHDRDPNHEAYRMHPDDGLISYVVQRAPETEEGEP